MDNPEEVLVLTDEFLQKWANDPEIQNQVTPSRILRLEEEPGDRVKLWQDRRIGNHTYTVIGIMFGGDLKRRLITWELK